MGVQGFKYATKDSVETWLKPLKDGNWAVCFLNRSKASQTIAMDWSKEEINDELSGRTLFKKTKYKLYNLWSYKAVGNTLKTLNATIPGHDVLMLKLSK